MASSEWQLEQSLHPYCVGSISSTIDNFNIFSHGTLYLPIPFQGISLSLSPPPAFLQFFLFHSLFQFTLCWYSLWSSLTTNMSNASIHLSGYIPFQSDTRERGRGRHSFRLKTIENIRFSVSAFIRASEWVNLFFLKHIIEVHLQTLSVCVCAREWVCRWYIWDLSMKCSKIVDVMFHCNGIRTLYK